MATEPKYDLVSIFDIATMILDGKMPASIVAPVCLDELVDWTNEAMTMANRLARSGGQLFPDNNNNNNNNNNMCNEFVLVQPFLRRIAADGKTVGTSDDVLCQTHVTRFPSCTFERTAFLDKHILIHMEAIDRNRSHMTHAAPPLRVAFSLSGLDFCIYMRLLRRLSQLSELCGSISRESSCNETEPDVAENLHECKICMLRPQDTVLPCLHGVCSSCEEKWVETHMDCPFCRTRYMNQRRRKREQWQVSELLSRSDSF